MLLLKKLVNSGAFQATLGSLKSCVTGIILATGAYMILTNCVGSYNSIAVDHVAIILTLSLGAIHFGSKKLMKNGLSPIILICIAGIAGIFGSDVCVEGIETAGMRDILQKYHVESFQGYYYAKPLKLEEIVKFESKKVTT